MTGVAVNPYVYLPTFGIQHKLVHVARAVRYTCMSQ